MLPYRQALDALTADDISWTPWATYRQHCPYDPVSGFSGYLRCGNTIVSYLPERVLRQFGYRQIVPRSPPERPAGADITVRWLSFHLYSIRYLLQLRQAEHPADCDPEYLDWYYRHSHPLLITP